jgi:hypothetical protein
MTRITIEAELETEQFTEIPILKVVIKKAIEGAFFIGTKITKLEVSKDDIPTEGI